MIKLKNRLFENSIGTLVGGIVILGVGVAAAISFYMLILIFTPIIVPSVLIFLPKVNKLISGIFGVILFAYYVVDIKIKLPPSEYYFSEKGALGEEYLIYLNILNYIGLAISMFMIYLYIDNKRFK